MKIGSIILYDPVFFVGVPPVIGIVECINYSNEYDIVPTMQGSPIVVFMGQTIDTVKVFGRKKPLAMHEIYKVICE